MPAHSRPKDGVATLAYVAGIYAEAPKRTQTSREVVDRFNKTSPQP
jgi:hypothetical protein